MNVLVIPEDFRKDEHVLKPVIQAMLAALGKPRAKVVVCKDPLLGGIDQALNHDRIREIVTRYRMVDLFLLCVDRDGQEGRRQALDGVEAFAVTLLPEGKCLMGVEAWQEIEVWALAGQDLPQGWSIQTIRDEPHPKENYFEPLAEQRKLLDEPGAGRKTMGREAGANYRRVRDRCREDVASLEERIRQWLPGRP
jgi:hypothetical protein